MEGERKEEIKYETGTGRIIEGLRKNYDHPITFGEDSSAGYYQKNGIWYEMVVGGEDIPLINVGPGPNPDPRKIGGCFYKD